jgi:hypothetical protein
MDELFGSCFDNIINDIEKKKYTVKKKYNGKKLTMSCTLRCTYTYTHTHAKNAHEASETSVNVSNAEANVKYMILMCSKFRGK